MKSNAMTAVDYDYDLNRGLHTVRGAAEALRSFFPDHFPRSVLDVGCGMGTWLRACLDRGVTDLIGIEVSEIRNELLVVPKQIIQRADLRLPTDLGRKFELVICLETAEHLEPEKAETLFDTLTKHGDHILFSAAAPGQGGPNHVNCQWPDYWQAMFNARGYVCSDDCRWRIWQNAWIEPWYRQNMMTVTRDPARAGAEPRIEPVIHPDLLPSYFDSLLRTMSGRTNIFDGPWWR